VKELQEQPYSIWISPVGKKRQEKEKKKDLDPHAPNNIHSSFFSQIEN